MPLSFEDSTQSDEPSAPLTLKTALLMESLKNSRHLNAEIDAACRRGSILGCSAFCPSVRRLAKNLLHFHVQNIRKMEREMQEELRVETGREIHSDKRRHN